MLRATTFLINRLDGRAEGGAAAAEAASRVVERLGSLADAEALLPVFLADPRQRARHLLRPLLFQGDARIARRLLEACCDERGLLPGMPVELLHLFGYHGLEEAQAMLWGYARWDGAWRGDEREVFPRTHEPAVLGLLHLPCDGIREEIEEAIHACASREYYPFSLPALAIKTGRIEMIDLLWRMGEEGRPLWRDGLALGIALFGEATRERFRAMLWSPKWAGPELFDGLCLLGITIGDVFEEWRARVESGEDPVRGLYLLNELLFCRLGEWHTGLRFAPAMPATHAQEYERIFARGGSTKIHELARRCLGADAGEFQFDVLDQSYRDRIDEEAVLGELVERTAASGLDS